MNDPVNFSCRNPSNVSLTTKHVVGGWICFSHPLSTFLQISLSLLLPLSLSPRTVYSSKSCRQHFLRGTLSVCPSLLFGLNTGDIPYGVGFPTLILQESATEEQSTKMFVVIIWINSRRYQVQRHQCHPGKVMPLCPLFTSREEAL